MSDIDKRIAEEVIKNPRACLTPYSTDIKAAFMVVEKMREDGWYLRLRDDEYLEELNGKPQFIVEFLKAGENRTHTSGLHQTDTPPMAICLAALAAKEDR